ncbi:hypothetical protein CVH10_11180 [Halomonas sp. ND22Bw]|uniref:helix-turn-helix transcriptional regulator n=1 Tax=Halomonas sp. ND22Bw TaxID=2054178 RepID=UPI000D0B7943|nr:hypothetical protein CVH10_11180 [Halomonas sp. ND22Bw]
MGEPAFNHGIDARQLRDLSAPLVRHQRLDAPDWDRRTALLDGHMRVAELQPGMRLRLAEVRDRFGLTSRAELPAGLKIALVIDGAARVRYGTHEVFLGPGGNATGLVAALPRATTFARLGQAGGFERTLTLGLSPHWLARHGHSGLLQGAMPHLSQWTPSPGLLALAAQLFTPERLTRDDAAHHLQLSGFAMALAGEALAVARPPTPLPQRLEASHSAPVDRRLARLMALVDDGQARGATQDDLARRLGMSLSNLQRRFRAQQGESLGRFLRRHHLTLARDALTREGASVEAAAALAGYTRAPNFATAFKREFGLTPSECRAARAGASASA